MFVIVGPLPEASGVFRHLEGHARVFREIQLGDL